MLVLYLSQLFRIRTQQNQITIMEDNNIIDASHGGDGLQITAADMNTLSETRKWAGFLAILGFIGTGLMVIVSLFAGSLFSGMGEASGIGMPGGMGTMMTVIYLVMAVLYFIPTYYLFNFSRKMKIALETKSGEALSSALVNHKSMYKFVGMFTAIVLGLYLFAGVIALFAGLMS